MPAYISEYDIEDERGTRRLTTILLHDTTKSRAFSLRFASYEQMGHPDMGVWVIREFFPFCRRPSMTKEQKIN